MARDTEWGIEQPLPLGAPLNTSVVPLTIFPIDKGGPALANNGVNRDGGIAELYETTTNLGAGQYGYVSSNGIPMVVDTVGGNIYSPTATSATSPGLYPSDTLHPSTILYPSGGFGNVQEIGRMNGSSAPTFFNKVQVPATYLDCVVASAPSGGVSTSTGYTLLAVRLGSNTTLVFEEIDPVTMQIYNSVALVVLNTFNRTGVAIVRANNLTWASAQTTSGFIYNVGTAVWYHVNGNDYNTAKTTDILQQNFCAYYNGGTTVFSTTYQGVGHIWQNHTAINTWAECVDPVSSTPGVTMGDFGAYTLAAANTALSLSATTFSKTVPAFWINVSAAGAVTTTTGWSSGTYTPAAIGSATGGLYSGATAAAAFSMVAGIVSPYGCCGTYKDTGTSNYGNFHTSVSQVNVTTATVQPSAFPQLDIVHKMLVVRSYNNQIALLCGNATGMGDANDCGNLINDFAGGTFGYDIMAGNVYNKTSANYFFYPLSWRGLTGTTGVTVYKLNNGQFVSVYTSTVPKFSEIIAGVVTMNTLSAWAAIIDLNSQVIHYNYSGYTPSFFFPNSGLTDSTYVQYLKIFDTYSSSIDEGQVYGNYNYVAPMATDVNGGKTTPLNWTAWNGQNGNYLGNYVAYTLGSTSTLATSLVSNGAYIYNANVPPGGDASFVGGGINMLNAVAIQTQGYFGYYLFPSGGGSNLLPWKFANVFIIHGIFYASNAEYIYQIILTQGTTGVVQGAPFKVAYAIGMQYLCASPERAYFLSTFDNSIFYFDGGQTLNKLAQFNQKSSILSAVYVVRDNALYMQTLTSLITLREESERFEAESSINVEPTQMTENILPAIFTSYSGSYLKATSQGIYFLCGTNYCTRQYSSGGSIIPLQYNTGYFSPGEFQTFQVGRITGTILCTLNLSGTIQIVLNYLLPDGTVGQVTDTQVMTNRNASGYYRFSYNPSIQGYFMAISVGVNHTTIEQKLDLLELLVYYKPDAEVIPLNEFAS